jgi:hypothetical protein
MLMKLNGFGFMFWAVNTAASTYDLVIGDGSGCEVHAVAYDGIWRTEVPNPVASSVIH